MNNCWSAFFSLLTLLALASCGEEQFGTTPQSKKSAPDPVVSFQQVSCSSHTLIKPEVDVLYVVDNSSSNFYISNDIKSGIQNTINSISTDFDYRVIGTPLLQTSGGNEDYQVLAKDPSTLPASVLQKQITSSSQFTFFSNIVQGSLEPGLDRVRSFITAHQSDGLFRPGAYLFIVLISNGYDTDIETIINPNGQTGYTSNGQSIFNDRKASLLQLKNYLQSQQFRLFSLVAHPGCTKSGWKAAEKSYIQISRDLYYQTPFPTDQSQNLTPDSYDLCKGNVSTVFSSVNNAIKQIIIPHTYKYWPITFTSGEFDTSKIKVFKSTPGTSPVQLTSGWVYKNKIDADAAMKNQDGSVNTRILPTKGEPTMANHLIEFSSGSEITYPTCVSVTSESNLEYFGFIALPKIPKLDTVQIKINGNPIPKSDTNGWSYIGQQTRNIKVSHDGYSDQPPVIRSGYMIQLNGAANFYKSGDNVQIHYIPATVN
jgi:hypothetical protein